LAETKGEAIVDLQTEVTNAVFIIYSNTGEHPNGLLNIEALRIIKKMEDKIKQDEGYKKFCLAKKPLQENDPVQCDSTDFKSAVVPIVGDLDIETATQQQVNDAFLASMKSPMWAGMSFLFDKELTPENLKIRYMRSLFSNGGPLQPNETFRF
jgi:hypothetical protein